MLMLAGYMRPSEPLKLTVGSVVPPLAGTMYKMWALVLSPREAGQQSNETILLDQGWMGDMLGPGLRWLKKHKKPHEYVYDFSAAHFKKVMGAAAVRAGVGMLQVHPCQIRHSGPSHDVAQASRSLMEIKLRGRWKADASMRRYTKGGGDWENSWRDWMDPR